MSEGQTVIIRRRRDIEESKAALSCMFDAINDFLNREGDKHFNPDRFDDIYETWRDTGEISYSEIEVVKKLFIQWVKQ